MFRYVIVNCNSTERSQQHWDLPLLFCFVLRCVWEPSLYLNTYLIFKKNKKSKEQHDNTILQSDLINF